MCSKNCEIYPPFKVEPPKTPLESSFILNGKNSKALQELHPARFKLGKQTYKVLFPPAGGKKPYKSTGGKRVLRVCFPKWRDAG